MTPEEKAALGYQANRRGGNNSLPVTHRVTHRPNRNQIGILGGVEGHLWQEDKLFAYRMVKSSQELTSWYLKLMGELITLKEKGLVAAIYTEICDVE
jgi:hypothetical protein